MASVGVVQETWRSADVVWGVWGVLDYHIVARGGEAEDLANRPAFFHSFPRPTLADSVLGSATTNSCAEIGSVFEGFSQWSHKLCAKLRREPREKIWLYRNYSHISGGYE
jgi:hypothetical protein